MTIQPVKSGEKGPKVSNLHDGLQYLLDVQPGISPNDREILKRRLKPEVDAELFGPVTGEIVGIYQYQLKHWPDYFPPLPKALAGKVASIVETRAGTGNGVVDTATAAGLNWLVKTFSGLPRLHSTHLQTLRGASS